MTATGSSRQRRVLFGCLGLITAPIAIGYFSFKVYEYRFEQARFPARIAVTKTVYKVTDRWGLGPSGNETGIIVYGFDNLSAERLERESSLLTSDGAIRAAVGNAKKDYSEWKRTPVDISVSGWSHNDHFAKSVNASPILRYLNQYGFGIDVDPSIVDEVDRTLSGTESYYAYGRGGSLIIISPKSRRLIFAYAG